MNKKPIYLITGLAVAAVAGIAGLTRDQWMGSPPPPLATADASKQVETPAPAAEKPAQTQQAETQAPAAEEAPKTAEAPAAEQPAAEQAATTTEQPAAEQPAAEAPAEAQTEAKIVAQVPAKTEMAAAQPEASPAKTEEPAAQPVAEQPAAAAEETPAFDTVRVEKTGEAVIAGRAEAGSEVVVKLDGQEIAKTTANEDGAFVAVPEQPLPAGSGSLTIEAKGKGDLNSVASEESVAVIVPAEQKQTALVAVVSPDAPTKVLQKPEPVAEPETQVAAAPAASDTQQTEEAAPQTAKPAVPKIVSIDAVDYDASGNIVFSGQGEPGHTARVYIDNTFIADATVGADGRWSYAGTADVGTGVHALRVDGLDAAGKVLNRVEVPFFREEQSKVAAAAQPEQQQPDQTVQKTEPEQQASTTAATAQDQEAAAPAAPKEGRVVIQPGNNLWRISRVLYGTGEKYTLLYQANKDQIRDPDLIYPGQIFKTPEVAAKIETVDPERREPLTPEEKAASGQ